MNWADQLSPAWLDADGFAVANQTYYHRLNGAVRDFLNLAGAEASACFERMFTEIGKSPLLGLSAIGGLIGLSAYVKALWELHHAGILDSDVIALGDIADIALRIAVPFSALAVCAALLMLTWTQCLRRDHRHTGWYAFVTLLLAAIFFVFYRFYAWIPGSPAVLLAYSFVVMGSLAIIPVLFLIWFGLVQPGVNRDDRLQSYVLNALRFCADPRMLLTIFVAICLVLIVWPEISVLDFDDSSTAHEPRALELTTGGPVLLVGPVARLSRGWVVRQIVPGVLRAPGDEEHDLLAISPTGVACLRDLTPNEEQALAAGRIPLLARECAKKPEESKPEPATWASVADYATRALGCPTDTFRVGAPPAILHQFLHDEPKDVALPKDVGTLLRVPAEALNVSGLPVADRRLPADSSASNNDSYGKPDRAKAWVLGFASIEGDPAHNLDLSSRRARWLRQELINGETWPGISPDRIEYRGLGVTFLSGVNSAKEVDSERIAIAFVCRES
jgi:hypothetical protein